MEFDVEIIDESIDRVLWLMKIFGSGGFQVDSHFLKLEILIEDDALIWKDLDSIECDDRCNC